MHELAAVLFGEKPGRREVQNYMKYPKGVLVVLFAVLLAGCAPKQPPQPDPLREEVAVLQKQLLELQRIQNENRATIEEFSAKILSLEQQLLRQKKPASRLVRHTPDGKKPKAKAPAAKKQTRKVRRQE